MPARTQASSPARKSPRTRDKASARNVRKTQARQPASRQPDAIALLKADHHAVAKLFKQYEARKDKSVADDKRALAEKICLELTVHTIIEEEILYPQVRNAVKGVEEMLEEAEVEHDSLKRLIADIRDGDTDDGRYDANVKVLGEYVKHHVEEEHDELFPKVQKSKLDLNEMGAELAARKAALMEGKVPH